MRLGKHATRRSLRPDRLRSMISDESNRHEDVKSLPTTLQAKFAGEDKFWEAKDSIRPNGIKELLESGDPDDEAVACPSMPVNDTKTITKRKSTPKVKTPRAHEENNRTRLVAISDNSGNDELMWDEVTSKIIDLPSPKGSVRSTSLSTPERFLNPSTIKQIEQSEVDTDAFSSDWDDVASPQRFLGDCPLLEATPPEDEGAAVMSIAMVSLADSVSHESQPTILLDNRENFNGIISETSERPVLGTSAELTSDDSVQQLSGILESVLAVKENPSSQEATKAYERSSPQQSMFSDLEINERTDSKPEDSSLIVDPFKGDSIVFPTYSDPAGENKVDESLDRSSNLLGEGYSPRSETGLLDIQTNASVQTTKVKDVSSEGHELDTNTANREAKETSEAASEALKGPGRRTRSGARFSDDTVLLQDFLNRAQASKAAKDLQVPAHVPAPIPSPRRSPRKALAEKDRNSPSPQKVKPHDLANRPGTPPGKATMEAVDVDDGDETAVESKSCRRSTRTRLFVPAKTPTSAPSCIPVRRPDGTESIVLPKPQAQELANLTRTNTRKNKGQSKPPRLTLKTLPAESAGKVDVGRIGRRDARSVGWDERLVYCQEGSRGTEQNKEKRPKIGRLRNLGAMNGTPAPKKQLPAADGLNGASTPKRRRRNQAQGSDK